jgi:hypothetical protein
MVWASIMYKVVSGAVYTYIMSSRLESKSAVALVEVVLAVIVVVVAAVVAVAVVVAALAVVAAVAVVAAAVY